MKHIFSMFHSAPNLARGKRSRNSISSVARYAFKTKLHLKNEYIFESQGGPWCFGGPTQLTYSVYMEDRLWFNEIMNEQTNEWINKLIIYIVIYCVLLYTQSTLQSCRGGSLLNHHQCAASTKWMQN